MKKVALGTIVLFVLGLFQPLAAHAAEQEFTVKVIKNTSCDQRAPRVEITISDGAMRVGYGSNDSDEIYWLDTHGVTPGVHRYNLQRQPFGSTREWVLVAAFRGAQGLYTAPLLTFTRPARADCVVKQSFPVTAFDDNVNQVCPEGSQKMFMLRAFVRKGSPGYFAGHGSATTTLMSGRQLTANGYVVPPKSRENDFFIYPSRRGAKVDKSATNSITLVLSSKNVQVDLGALSSDCIEEFAG